MPGSRRCLRARQINSSRTTIRRLSTTASTSPSSRFRRTTPTQWLLTSRHAESHGETIDLALRWAREYDLVSREKGIEALLAAVPDAEVVTLDDVNHNFVIDNPDVVARLINDYLDRIRR